MFARFPFVIENFEGTAGWRIHTIEDLRRLAREKTKLSSGFIQTADEEDLLPIVVKSIRGRVIPL